MIIEYINGGQVVTHPSGHVDTYTADQVNDYLNMLNDRRDSLFDSIELAEKAIDKINGSIIIPE